ncbi:TPA: hypothetical protein ACN35U_000307 [Vibrio parahaemolyticus]
MKLFTKFSIFFGFRFCDQNVSMVVFAMDEGKESVPLQLFELTAKVGFNEGFIYIAANKGV